MGTGKADNYSAAGVADDQWSCTSKGQHRVNETMHKLYAFDAVLADLKSPTKAKLLEAMQGHVLAQAELIGTYEKSAR